MFCMNCGTKLADDAAFCTNCGNAVASTTKKEKVKEKIIDDKVELNVKPTFKFWFMAIPYVVVLLVLIAPFLLMLSTEAKGGELVLGILLFLGVPVLLFMAIILFLVKKQYKAYNYDFYKTKVIYRDSFINISEKEVKYKNIREVSLRRGLIQRGFNLGTIVLYTNAETGYANGIMINNVENAEQVYKNIKELINAED